MEIERVMFESLTDQLFFTNEINRQNESFLLNWERKFSIFCSTTSCVRLIKHYKKENNLTFNSRVVITTIEDLRISQISSIIGTFLTVCIVILIFLQNVLSTKSHQQQSICWSVEFFSKFIFVFKKKRTDRSQAIILFL